MIKMMKENREALGVPATEAQFDSTIARSRALLTQRTLDIDVDLVDRTTDTGFFGVRLQNRAGHRFPSGYPSRRAFVRLVVRDALGDTVFVSGDFDADHEVVGHDALYEPHYDVIREENQVQTYELVMGDVNGDPTTVLERAKQPLKDNRLVPLGFLTSHPSYDTTRIAGNVLSDADLNRTLLNEEGSGTDVVHYHVDRLDADLADVAQLGIGVWRYGMPWRLAEPEPGVYAWTQWDRALRACERHGLSPVVDLCHFGLPDHYPGFCDPAWIEGFCRYVDAFLTRYREPMWFTPVNEPGMTALFSARYGLWNDRRSTEDDFFVALGHLTLANLEALARIGADRDGWWIGSEGFGCELADPDDEAGTLQATDARDLQHAEWDLHFGLDPVGVAAAGNPR